MFKITAEVKIRNIQIKRSSMILSSQKRMRWAQIGKMINGYRILNGQYDRYIPLGRCGLKLEDNIEMNLSVRL